MTSVPRARSLRLVHCSCGCGQVSIGFMDADGALMACAILDYREAERIGSALLDLSDAAGSNAPHDHIPALRH